MPALLLQPAHPAYDPRLLYHPPLDGSPGRTTASSSPPPLVPGSPHESTHTRLSYPYTRFPGYPSPPLQPPMFPQWTNPAAWIPPVSHPPPPAQQPQAQAAQRVWILDCKNCGMFLTNRGMKVRTSSSSSSLSYPLRSELPDIPVCPRARCLRVAGMCLRRRYSFARHTGLCARAHPHSGTLRPRVRAPAGRAGRPRRGHASPALRAAHDPKLCWATIWAVAEPYLSPPICLVCGMRSHPRATP